MVVHNRLEYVTEQAGPADTRWPRSILNPRGVESMLIVSDGFHLYRSKMLAENAGFEAYGYAAENSPIRDGSGTELRYMIRETFAVLAWKLNLSR